MGPLLCILRRHDWLRRRDRVAEAGGGRHLVCRRCGRERVEYKEPPPTGVAKIIGTGGL